MNTNLYYALEETDSFNLYLIKFYVEENAVLFKKVPGGDANYLKKEILNFKKEGFTVFGQPEYTYWGAYLESAKKVSFKVENEVSNSSDSWATHEVLEFKGTFEENDTIQMNQKNPHVYFESNRLYTKTTESDLIALLVEKCTI
jgi:hypothetical protein